MTQFAQHEQRINLRVPKDIKILAERASVASGCKSVTEYIISVIRECAPKTLQEAASIQLTNEQYDHFIAVCNDTNRKPSARILEAAKRLDEEGF